MNSPQHFLAQLKKAQLRNKQNKSNIQAITAVETKVASSTGTATHTKMSDDLYRTLIVAKAIHHIKQRGV